MCMTTSKLTLKKEALQLSLTFRFLIKNKLETYKKFKDFAEIKAIISHKLFYHSYGYVHSQIRLILQIC